MKKVIIIGAGGIQARDVILKLEEGYSPEDIVFISDEELKTMSMEEIGMLVNGLPFPKCEYHEQGIQTTLLTNSNIIDRKLILNSIIDDFDNVEVVKKEHPFKKFMGKRRNF